MNRFLYFFLSIMLFQQTYSQSNNYYTVIESIEDVEVRQYKKMIYASYTPIDQPDRGNSFKNVAGYIFGSNDKNQNIKMTSPVVVKLHNDNEMAFIMPDKYQINNLPIPNNDKIQIYEEPKSIKAAIRYGGYSNEKIEKNKISELKRILLNNEITHHNNFEVLVYNSPYKIFNRRNEIVVSIDFNLNSNNMSDESKIYFGSGCFWCTEAIFENVIGVNSVTSGYSGGKIANPSYKEVSRGLTQHAEVCEISYNPQKVSLHDLLKIFFFSHDPTTLNRQGNDIGAHYRSIILFGSNQEKLIVEDYIDEINQEFFDNKIITELKKFKAFYRAEDYHQNYYDQNSMAPYCQLVIAPKVLKVRNDLKVYYK